jgi:hypothetical protein
MTYQTTITDPTLLLSYELFVGDRKSVANTTNYSAVDLTGDGLDEVIFSAWDHSFTLPHENSLLQIFSFENGVWTNSTDKFITDNEIGGSDAVVDGDFNNDGVTDFFAWGQSDTELVYPVNNLFLSSTTGYKKIDYEFGSWNHDAFVADVNQDGFDDVLLQDYGPNTGIAFGSATGLNFKPTNFRGFWTCSGISAADYLGDGSVTILASDATGDWGTGAAAATFLFSWSLDQENNLSFNKLTELPAPRFELPKWASYSFGSESVGASHDIRILPFDFSGDGLADAIEISRPSITNGTWPDYSEVQFLLNKGAGVFEDVTDSVLVDYPYPIASSYNPVMMDINNDGLVDIFLGSEHYNDHDYVAVCLMQQTDGKFYAIGLTEFADLWAASVAATRELNSGYTFDDWTNPMGIVKAADGNNYIFSNVASQDNNDQIFQNIFVSRLTVTPNLSLSFDVSGTAGQAYRIYRAAFDRDPMIGDTAGLGYWIAQMDAGMSMTEVAARFIDSAEFRELYGATPTNGEFLTKVYNNVLDRDPDSDGYVWWMDQLANNPEKTWQKVLADFSESTENQTNVAGLIGNGITYDAWTG